MLILCLLLGLKVAAADTTPDSIPGLISRWEIVLDLEPRAKHQEEARQFISTTLSVGYKRISHMNPELIPEVLRRLGELKSVQYTILDAETYRFPPARSSEYAMTTFESDPLEIFTRLQWISSAGVLDWIYRDRPEALTGLSPARYSAIDRYFKSHPGPGAQAKLSRLFELETRSAQNSVLHESFHMAGLSRSLFSTHGSSLAEADPIYSCVAEAFPDDIMAMKRRPGVPDIAYLRTQTACETCVLAEVNGSDFRQRPRDPARVANCKDRPDAEFPSDPHELELLKKEFEIQEPPSAN